MTTGFVRLSDRASMRARLLGVSDLEVDRAFEEMESAFERGRSLRSTTEPIDVEGLTLPTTSYVICATFRTGSTLLRDWLASTGVLGHPDEHCSPGSATFIELWSAALGTHTLVPYLAATARRHQTANGVFGTKAHFRHFLPVILAGALDEVGLRPTYIYLERRDLLAQTISLTRAAVTSSWNSTEPETKPAEFDEEVLLKLMARIARERQHWERYFALVGVTPLRLVYEDMVGDPMGTVARVAEHVGVDLERLDETPSSPLQVQRDQVSEEWAARLRGRFSGGGL